MTKIDKVISDAVDYVFANDLVATGKDYFIKMEPSEYGVKLSFVCSDDISPNEIEKDEVSSKAKIFLIEFDEKLLKRVSKKKSESYDFVAEKINENFVKLCVKY